jgi:hypothetical protein
MSRLQEKKGFEAVAALERAALCARPYLADDYEVMADAGQGLFLILFLVS